MNWHLYLRLGLVAALMRRAMSIGSEYSGAVYYPSTNCLVSSAITRTESGVSLKRCAHMCIGDTNCAAMGYTEGTQTCRLGSDIMDSATLDTDCVAAETVYESTTGKSPLGCDLADDWVYNSVSSTCIKIYSDTKTRAMAQADCETVGASLAVWDSQDAINLWRSLVESNTDWEGNGGGIWTGAQQISGSWTWTSGSTWVNWNEGEPNGNGLCIQIYRSDRWNMDDLQCDHDGLQYVCEKSLDS